MANQYDSLNPPLTSDDLARVLRYVSGEYAPAEAAELTEWVQVDPARRRLVDTLVATRRAVSTGQKWDTERGLSALVAERHAHTVRRASRRFPTARIAAAVVLFAIGGITLQRILLKYAPVPAHPPVGATAPRIFVTAPGQRATVTLHDGTRVILNVASTLRVPATFGTQMREVFLEGEAYFEVAHDATRPFTVHAGRSATDVLGTRFGVRAYLDDATVEVAVAEGRVGLRRDDASVAPTTSPIIAARRVLLTHGMVGRIGRDGEPGMIADGNVTERLGWKDGRLVFRNVTLRDALPRIARWYAVDLRLGDAALGNRRLAATFVDDPLTDVVRLLEVALDVHAERRGDTIILTARGERP